MSTTAQRQIRKRRTRVKINGTAERPRLSIAISNRHINAQIVDDAKGATLVFVTTVNTEITGNMVTRAKWVGEQIAATAKVKKIKKIVFDRGSRSYQGRMDALAQAARAKGLEF